MLLFVYIPTVLLKANNGFVGEYDRNNRCTSIGTHCVTRGHDKNARSHVTNSIEMIFMFIK